MKKIKLYIMSLLMVLPLAIVASLDIFSKWLQFRPIGDMLNTGNTVALFCIILTILAFCFHLEFNNKSKDSFDSLPVSITAIENVNSEFISFFMTLLAVLAFDLTSVRGAILFVMVLALFGCLFVKTELFYSNPCFAILKYHIYRVDTKDNAIPETSIVISRDKLSNGDYISKIKLSEHVFFCKKASQQCPKPKN